MGLAVGTPGFWESLIPVWGSGRAAINDFQEGRYGWGVFNTAMAISDVFLIKALYTGVLKVGVKSTGKMGWKSVRSWLGKKGFAKSGQHVHHWLIPQGRWGKYIPNWIKNQPWNLLPMKTNKLHHLIHSKRLNIFGRIWLGTPLWVKLGAFSSIGRFWNEARDDGEMYGNGISK